MGLKREDIDSPLFGPTQLPTDEERAAIKKFVDELPVGVFQELSKAMNARGLMLSIDVYPEAKG